MALIKAIFILAGLAASISVAAAPSPPWADSFLGRVEARAVLQTLNADLLSDDSATLTLDRYRSGKTPLMSSHSATRAQQAWTNVAG